MEKFMDENFLLSNETARRLYFDYAAKMPVVDYHCHVSPQEIYEDRQFDSITQAWLGGDHYKWRMIRSNAVDEENITGAADDKTKFDAFAAALPKAIGNPLYHWTHLELQRFFDCTLPLNPESADEIWELCNAKLKAGMGVRKMIEMSNVTTVCTTDDPIDSLEWHEKLAADTSLKTKVLPAFRPDKAINVDKTAFTAYLAKLEEVTGMRIQSVDDMKQVLKNRLDYFEQHGCCASDHGLDYVPHMKDAKKAERALACALSGNAVTAEDAEAYKTELLVFLGSEYAKRGWVMQWHYGAVRNPNSQMFKKLGPDSGFDTIGTRDNSQGVVALLDLVLAEGKLPKTILYSLNPSDNAMLGAAIGAFQNTEIPGQIQHGSAWWFNDTKIGMEEQMKVLASLGILGNFIGMLTDSRSFLSYTRHEYFRRILCNLIGEWVENGEYPADMEYLGQMVQNISYNNAMNYFGFNK